MVISLNIAGCRSSADLLKVESRIMYSDILYLQEMRLTPNQGSAVHLPNFNRSFANSKYLYETKCIFVKDSINLEEHIDESHFTLTKIELPNQRLTVLSVYRPHRVSFRQFRNDLVTFIDKYKPTLVIGDFNIDVKNNLFPQFEADLKSRNLFLMNTKPTHRLGSTLDYAFSKDPTVYFRQFSVPFSDHDVIQVAFF